MPHHDAAARRRGRPGLARRLAAMVALAVLAAACARGGGSDVDPASAAAVARDYPSLATVPARPRLGYGLEQKRAVEGELVRDRENAAYLGALLDYETGRADTPPPAPPPEPGAPPAAAPAARAPVAAERRGRRGPGDSPAVEAYVDDAMARDEDDGELRDFLRQLERPAPGAGERASVAAAVGLGGSAPPDGDTGAGAERPRSPALQRFGGYLGGVLGVERAEPPRPAAPAEVARVAFAAGSDALPTGAEEGLARALAEARAAGARLRIAGGGNAGALRADRARAVALALTRLGASPDQLDLPPDAGGGEEEEEAVRVILAPRRQPATS